MSPDTTHRPDPTSDTRTGAAWPRFDRNAASGERRHHTVPEMCHSGEAWAYFASKWPRLEVLPLRCVLLTQVLSYR